MTELEVGFSERSTRDDTSTSRRPPGPSAPGRNSGSAEQRARELQALLARRGQHRGVSISDLILAPIAVVEQLVVLHDDRGFDLITEVTGQPSERAVPEGSID